MPQHWYTQLWGRLNCYARVTPLNALWAAMVALELVDAGPTIVSF